MCGLKAIISAYNPGLPANIFLMILVFVSKMGVENFFNSEKFPSCIPENQTHCNGIQMCQALNNGHRFIVFFRCCFDDMGYPFF